MLTLATADTLAAGADAAAKVTCTVMGMELVGTTETYKVLDQRQLASSPATIYTVAASTTAFIRSISVVNTDTVTRTFQLFRGGTAAANAITPVFTLAAGDMATYEDGLGWQFTDGGGSTITSLGGTQLNDVHSGYSEYQAISNPSTPATDTLRIFARKVAGRMLPKWIPPSGVDNPVQPALFGNNVVTYVPSSSTNGGTATLGGWGISWTAGGTVSHPTPSSTSPAVVNQMHRTRYANVVTTTNQTLGIMSNAAGLPQFWRGNSSNVGGFFFAVRFVVELWPAATVRIFVGLSDSTTAQATLDIASMTGNLCAFAHDTTDAASVLWFVTRDGSTTHKTAITLANNLAAGQSFDAYIFCKPGDSTIYYRLDEINGGTTLADTSETNNIPTATAFMGPQIHMSNGTANTTVTTTAIAINRVYIESDH